MLKTSTFIATVFVLLVAGSFFYQRNEKNHQFQTGGEFAQFLATEAIRDAKQNNHVLLDYTPDSIQIVESILGNDSAQPTAPTLGKSSAGAKMERDGTAMTPWREKNRIPCIAAAAFPSQWPGATNAS